MKNLLRLAAFAALACASAHASPISYSYIGTGQLAGSTFTYVSQSGFLNFHTGHLKPTTFSDLFFGGTDQGAITYFDFVSPTNYLLGFQGGYATTTTNFSYQINAVTSGEDIGNGLLTVTPEPSSFVLLGSGILTVIGVARRRFRRA